MATTATTPLTNAPELCRLGATELVEAYRAHALSPIEVTDAVLAHIESSNPESNAFRFVDDTGARAAARASERRWRARTPLGPVDGVPTTIKDLIWVEGWVVRYGSRTTPATPCIEDAPATARLRASGAVLIGLTTSPEFGWKAVTDSALTGVTRNPWDLDRTPGGSSGGAAAAAAAGMGALHLGTDGGGSIRIPCAFTGTTGIKPTFGRVPAYPLSPFGTVSHLGPMARSVADAALMLSVLAGSDPRDWHGSFAASIDLDRLDPDLRGRRVGVWRRPPNGDVSQDVSRLFELGLGLLADLGAELERFELPEVDVVELFWRYWCLGASRRVEMVPEQLRAQLDPGLLEVASAGAELDRQAILQAQDERARFGSAMEALLTESLDLVVSPATPFTAFAAGHEVPPGSRLERWTEWAGFSYPLNVSQQPALVLPCGHGDNGMPVGLQLVGRKGADIEVVGAGLAFERARSVE